jgi:DNA-binding transcriptional ArsR family regulator
MASSDVSIDARNLRGIAHPVRVRMLSLLRTEGPATASGLARALGLNTGATSYHLRMLAEHGFIAEVPDKGSRRERWWQAAHDNTLVSKDALKGGGDGDGSAFLRSIAQVAADNIVRAVDARPGLSEEWRDAEEFSDYLFRLTPAETKVLVQELHRVLKRRSSREGKAPEGAARVAVQFQVIASPDEPTR